jgi:hypothetical protein
MVNIFFVIKCLTMQAVTETAMVSSSVYIEYSGFSFIHFVECDSCVFSLFEAEWEALLVRSHLLSQLGAFHLRRRGGI